MITTSLTNLRAAMLAAGLYLGMAIAPLHAAVITVDPDSFAEGTDISSAFAGVTLSTVGGGLGADGRVFALNPSTKFLEAFDASTGQNSFGHTGVEFPHIFRELGSVVLRVDFAAPAHFVAIDFISNDFAANVFDIGLLQAFDASNNLVGSYQTAALAGNEFETMSVSTGTNNIAYLLAGGLTTNDGAGLDNLRYDSAAIPEPGTFGLAGLAVLALGAGRRRARARK